jgi:hypothetical protein
MKKLIFTILIKIFFVCVISAQDIITDKNGEDIMAKVIEVTQTEIKYKKYDNKDGPLCTIPKSDVLIIKYENGTKDVFIQDKTKSSDLSEKILSISPADIRPGMSYSDFSGKYDSRLYIPQSDDPYSPSLCGVASFFVPGLGEMIAGEVGNGILALIFVYGSNLVGAVGLSTENYYAEGCLFSILGTYYWVSSIVSAVHTAKIKNMYYRDVRNMSTIDIEINPFTNTEYLGSNKVTYAGVSLKVSF